ncbi:hypothetical protein O3G_MSEX007945 [Manduca sexta]|uniref:Uncharacterized protein n=1 Tax=Manduca sexta TaxID=7130 RepID=A0A921Z8N9_MANSE|nr:hypothetical protein O3G_MSEX007945 [Manduca sexta]
MVIYWQKQKETAIDCYSSKESVNLFCLNNFIVEGVLINQLAVTTMYFYNLYIRKCRLYGLVFSKVLKKCHAWQKYLKIDKNVFKNHVVLHDMDKTRTLLETQPIKYKYIPRM